MNGQQLKNSILQMAVQGKLVPQDPNDEPASVLLERIRKEKEKLIKEGKIKKEKNPSYIFRGADNLPYEKVGNNEPVCIADEVPFEIPESWEWVRLGTVFNIEMGQSPTGNTVSSNKNGIEFHQGKVHFGEIFLQESGQYTTDPKKYAEQNSVLLCVRAPVGKVNITRRKICIGRGLCAILPFADMPLMFLYHLLEAYENIFVKQATGTTFIAITAETVKNQLIPLPPLEEQKRIADKIRELYAPLKKYEKVESATRVLNTKFPEQLKKSILQWAVRGKLVPQNSNDEPAVALLDRIRTEKQQLIKAGKIKRDKHESIIFRRDNSYYDKCDFEEICIDDEIPFDPPATWEFVRLNDIGDYRKGPFGSNLTKSMFVPRGENTVKVYEQKNAIQKDHTLGSYYIRRDYYESKMSSFTVLPGDIIVSCAGTIGETYIMPKNIELGIINQALMRIRIYAPIDIDFFLLYFDYVIKKQTKENSKGSAIKNIPPFEVFKRIVLPLPPVEEQKRIVERVHQILDQCNKF